MSDRNIPSNEQSAVNSEPAKRYTLDALSGITENSAGEWVKYEDLVRLAKVAMTHVDAMVETVRKGTVETSPKPVAQREWIEGADESNPGWWEYDEVDASTPLRKGFTPLFESAPLLTAAERAPFEFAGEPEDLPSHPERPAEPAYPESVVREFLGYLSGDVEELRKVPVWSLADSWEGFKRRRAVKTSPERALDELAAQAQKHDMGYDDPHSDLPVETV